MKAGIRTARDNGFSMIELMVSLLILLPIMGAVVSLLSVSVQQNAAEQSGGEAVREGRAGLEMMVQEIAQAGSHRDVGTTLSSNVSPLTTVQTYSIASSTGINGGDLVQVGGVSTPAEEILLTAVGTNSISGIFRTNHNSGEPVRLFALPFASGVVPPTGLGASSSTTVTSLKLFGDINADGVLNYVVYNYDSANAQITRSMTPVSQSTMNTALPLISHIKSNSVGFTLNTDSVGVVTSVGISMVIQNTVKSGDKFQEIALSSRVVIPSAAAASILLHENQALGADNPLPPTPAKVVTWSSQ